MSTLNAQATACINDGPPYSCDVTIEQDVEMVRSASARKPAPSWMFTDERGHFHAFAEGGELPTLHVERVGMPCDGSCDDTCGGEGYTVDRYTCRICGQEIKPQYVADVEAMTMGTPVYGRKSATVFVNSTGPIGNTGDEVTIRVKSGSRELLGVGVISNLEVQASRGSARFTTTILARSLEPRMSA